MQATTTPLAALEQYAVVMPGSTTTAPTPAATTTRAPRTAPNAYPVDDLRASTTRGAVPPVVTKAGKRAFEVTYPKGQRGGSSSNSNFTIAPAALFPTNEIRISFKLWFDDSFPWTPTASMPRIGGKLGGFEVGKGAASGGEYSATAASFRITFSNEGGLLAYVYPQLRRSFSDPDGSNIPWSLLDQTPGMQKISKVNKGLHVFVPEGGKRGDFDLKMRKGAWNDISMYVKLNTPGKYDGILEVAVNGVRERTEEARLRYTDIPVTGFLMHTFFGGSQRPPTDTKAWYADFSFSKT